METVTRAVATDVPPPTEASTRTSSSDPDEAEATLLRIALGAKGLPVGLMSFAELKAAEAEHLRNAPAEEAAERSRREHEAARLARENLLEAIRLRVRRDGGDPDGMDEAALRDAVQRIDAGQERDRDERARQKAETDRVERAKALFAGAGFPRRHTRDLERLGDGQDGKWTKLRDLLLKRAGSDANRDGFLVALLGGRGVGKTEMAVSVGHRFTQWGRSCRYVKAIDLFRDLRRAYTPVARGQAGVSEDEVVTSWVRPNLLIIDELHQRGETDAENNALINLLDRRYDDESFTLLIANQDRAEFAKAMGASFVSRVHQTGAAIICNWPSFRRPDQGGWDAELKDIGLPVPDRGEA